ncbi:VPLPA-CTERM sorting domain-containing protein [Falsiroseomonas oryzae]|uniref:VPLPA-CTERM sorting domain-containing protein n=1 Tax=Falsiroseomonas oryzae TaxID=2766473 RepID=UPI0022EA5B4F|nr:VPLPA-CTERM sorting domain-containing protein [Roseomonas sp. MO-31]
MQLPAGLRAAALVVACGMAVAAKPADAAFTFTVLEQGANVVATGSGSLNIYALTRKFDNVDGSGGVKGDIGFIGVGGGSLDVYEGLNGPTSFGPPGPGFLASTTTNVVVAIFADSRDVWVPGDYISGAPLSASMTFANHSFATLGLTPGTYVWTWGEGERADSFTVQIGPAVIGEPEPASALLLGAGLLGLAAVRRHRR